MTIFRISLEWRYVNLPGGVDLAGHMCLVARTENQHDGQGFVISGNPQNPGSISGNYGYLQTNLGNGAGSALFQSVDIYGDTDTEVSRNSYDMTDELEARFPNLTLDEIWDQMVSYADQINNAQFVYDPSAVAPPSGVALNSNSLIGSVLSSMGMNASDFVAETPLNGFPGVDTLLGTAGDDTLFATLRNTDLFGGSGADTLHSFVGDDYLGGGAGLDTASYANLSAGVSVTSVQDGTMTVDKSGLGTDTLTSIEHIVGTAQGDTFTVGGNGSGSLQINGGAGNDVYTVTGNGAEGAAIWLRAGMGESTIEVLGTGGGNKMSAGGVMYSTTLSVSGAGLRPAGVELFTHEGHVTLDLSQVAGDTTIGELDRDIVADQLAWKVGTGADGYSGRGYFADGTEIGFSAVSEVRLGEGNNTLVVSHGRTGHTLYDLGGGENKVYLFGNDALIKGGHLYAENGVEAVNFSEVMMPLVAANDNRIFQRRAA